MFHAFFQHMKSITQPLQQGLSTELLEILYGAHYKIIRLQVKPADCGHSGVNRKRAYFVLVHRKRARMVYDISALYAAISARIRAIVSTTPSDYLISSSFDVDLEVDHVARRRHLQARGLLTRDLL